MTASAEKLVLATRKSPLALKQANWVAELIASVMGQDVELCPMSTTGDRQADWSLQEKGGKGLFTKELEVALLDGRVDLAVHSAKDLPTENPAGLVLSAFPIREDPRDILVLNERVEHPKILASGSPRRRAQLKNRFPQVSWKELRGNVETRLRKIAVDQEADGTILAAAGLSRLGIKNYPGLKFEKLPIQEMVPAPGQAAIAIQVRAEESEKFSVLDHKETSRAVRFERSILDRLGGGCQVALGVHVVGNNMYFFHEDCGIRMLEISDNPIDVVMDKVLSWLK
ncbi:MAG: hydroxymethylbilane synthase [Opitutales bacterium]